MIEQLNDETFKTEVLAKPGIAVVDFWAGWCGPCRMLAPHIEALANDFAGQARVYKLDVEVGQETAVAMGIMNIPCVIFFKDGKVVDKSIGLVPKEVLANKLRPLL